jgi:hypothetical protein
MVTVPPKDASAILVSKNLQRIAKLIDRELERAAPGERITWTLFVWTPEIANYVGNAADRREVMSACVALFQKWAAGLPDIPAHERN